MSLPAGLLEPHLRLFLSVDVQDSTAFKQQADDEGPAPWRDYFLAFFSDFPSEFERCLPPNVPVPPVWKLLGDEIVFTHRLTTLAEIAPVLSAFRSAVAHYRPRAHKLRNFRLKGSAWVAGFPVGNAVVPVRRKDGASDEDYIGPTMDTGFRLSRMASRRKLALSVELAWLALHLPAAQLRTVPMFYGGRCHLKGVMERDGYPFIWIDLFHGDVPRLEAAEDALKRIRPAHPGTLRRFCERYIRQHGEPRFVPFIPGAFDRRSLREKRIFQEEYSRVEAALKRSWPELTLSPEAIRDTTSRHTREIYRTLERLLAEIPPVDVSKRQRRKHRRKKS